MTWRYRIIKKLQEYNINGNMFNFIFAIFSNIVNSKMGPFYQTHSYGHQNGIPQGFVLSVVLFLIAVNDISLNIEYPVQSMCFADDLVIFCRDRDINFIQETLQEAIKNLEIRSNQSGFIFSTEKTKCMHYIQHKHRAPQHAINPPLALNNQNLEYLTSMRYLGIIIDQRLNWIQHFKQVKQNCTQSFNILKYISNQGWGADKTILMKIYKSLIASKINYGSVAYIHLQANQVSK